MEDNLNKPIDFKGSLSAQNDSVSINFRANIDEYGDVNLHLEDMPFNNDTKFICFNSDTKDGKVSFFKLSGLSGSGIRFETETLLFRSVGHFSDMERGAYFRFDPQCQMAKFHRTAKQSTDLPELVYYLKGFESGFRLSHACQLGQVFMSGPLPETDLKRASGQLAIRAATLPPHIMTWKEKSNRLLEYVKSMMSFSAGRNLRSPVIEFRFGDDVEVLTYRSDSRSDRGIPTIHALGQEHFFEKAVESFFSPCYPVKNLPIFLEWFSMTPSYNEVKLLSAMTALETITNSNIQNKDILTGSMFERLRKRIKCSVDLFFDSCSLDNSEGKKKQVTEKMAELKRRSFESKLFEFIGSIDVDLCGLDKEDIKSAIKARNLIVHEGFYYKAGQEQTDLWLHVSLIREILVRIIFQIVGFKGQYISHYGGYHNSIYPPNTKTEK